MDLQLRDRSVVVTGAGSNIGRAIALAFDLQPADVVGRLHSVAALV